VKGKKSSMDNNYALNEYTWMAPLDEWSVGNLLRPPTHPQVYDTSWIGKISGSLLWYPTCPQVLLGIIDHKYFIHGYGGYLAIRQLIWNMNKIHRWRQPLGSRRHYPHAWSCLFIRQVFNTIAFDEDNMFNGERWGGGWVVDPLRAFTLIHLCKSFILINILYDMLN
jgi:hypothetical protein